MLRRNHSSIQRFDIELYGNSGRDDDVVLLTGPALEAGSCSLKGKLVWSTLEHTNIRKITLKLVGTLQLSWAEPGIHKMGPLPLRFEKHIYSQEYKNFTIPGQLVEKSLGNSRTTPTGSSTSLNHMFEGGTPVSPKSPKSPKRSQSRSGSLGNLFQSSPLPFLTLQILKNILKIYENLLCCSHNCSSSILKKKKNSFSIK